jgi:hypothetical protein
MKAVYPFVTDYRNLLAYTEDFSNAAWNKFNLTVTTNSVVAPDGNTTADTLTDNTTNGFHYIGAAATSFGQNGNNTYSLYAKANTLSWIVLYIFDGTSSNYTYFNVSNGTIGSNASGNIASIVDAGNGWYRCIVTRNYNATAANANCGFILANGDGVASYAGTGKSLYVWGAQFEIGASATTYQPVLGVNNYATNVASQMKFNLVNPQDSDAAFRLAFSGGWTYSTNGALPNGTNAYADTFLTPSTNLVESSKHLSFYLRTDNTPINADPINIGALSGTQRDFLLHSRVSINGQLSSILATNAITNPIGYSLITRSSTTNNLFKNNSKVNTASGAGTSSTGKVFVGALNLNGGGYGYTNNQLALASIGDGLSDAEAALLTQLVTDFQTTLSRNV